MAVGGFLLWRVDVEKGADAVGRGVGAVEEEDV
jgi:hypothetical protein